jgi:uncharacterized membrane protein (DUF4010 family)
VIRRESVDSLPTSATPRAFRLSHALLLAALMAVLLVVSAWLQKLFGSTGAVAAAAAVALVEAHAAAASIAQLAGGGQLAMPAARWGVVLLLVMAALAKSGLAFFAGGSRYGWRVAPALWVSPLAAGLVVFLLNIDS